MKSRLNYKSKRTIIIVAIIIALLAIASTGIYMFTKGNDEARAFTEGNTTIGGSETNPGSEGNNPTENNGAVEEQPTIEPNVEPEQGSQNNNEGTTTETQTPNTQGTTNRPVSGTTTSTTNSNVPNGEYVTERQEEVERLVSESFLVGWAPISVSAMTDDIELNKANEEANYEVSKVATLVNGETIRNENGEFKARVKPGDKVTYVITVRNTGNVTLKNIKVVDELANYEETIPVLAIGDSKELEVIYEVKQEDMTENDTIINVAKVTVPDVEEPKEEPKEEIPANPQITISGTKTWVDGNKTHNNANEIILTLYRISAKEGSLKETVKATPTWNGNTYTFSELEKYDEEGYVYTYSVEETQVEGYENPSYDSTNSNNITNTITDPSNVTVSGTKTWVDGNKDHNNAEDVELKLYRKSAKSGSAEEIVTATVKWEGNKYTFSGLENYDTEGYVYTYRVEEKQVEGYEKPLYDSTNANNITNTITDPSNVTVSGTKTWVDGNKDHNNAEDVELKLYRKSVKAGSVEEIVTATAKWEGNKYTFSGLENYDTEGYVYTYRVEEKQVEGYEKPSYDSTNPNNITNTITDLSNVTVSGTKTWVDGNKAHNNAEDVKLTLYRISAKAESVEEIVTATVKWEGNKYIFSGLENYDEEGYAYTYRVEETQVEGYENPSYDSTNANNITNTITDPSNVTISGTKTWVDGNKAHNNADEITLTLYRKSAKAGSSKETVKATPTWNGNTYTFSGLENYDEEGYAYTYSVEETQVNGYEEPSYDSTNANNITNTITDPSNVTISGTKTWVDGNKAHNNADEITLTLYRISAKAGSSKETVKATPTWNRNTYTFSGLENYDEEGYAYTYRVEEKQVKGYENPSYDSTNPNNITNTITDPSNVTVSGTKTWVDGNKEHNNANEITLTLYRISAKTGSSKETVEATPTWNGNTYTFSGLENYDEEGYAYTYSVEETQVNGYEEPSYDSTNANNITNTITDPSNVTISGTKTWVDGNKEHNNANEITLTLYRISAKTGSSKETVEATPTWNGNTYTFSGLENYDEEGYAYTYSVEEKQVEGYEKPSYDLTNANNITNTIKQEKTSIIVSKVWSDGSNQDNSRPTSIKVGLYADDKLQDKAVITLTEANKVGEDKNLWKYPFDNLDKYDLTDGHIIKYKVKELNDDNEPLENGAKDDTYTVNYEIDNENKVTTITNTYIPQVNGTGKIRVTKVWENDEEIKAQRPEVTINLIPTGETLKLNKTNKWTGEFKDLPKYDADGNEIEYSITENEVKGYSPNPTITGDVANGFKVTNTYLKPEITVTKTSSVVGKETQDGKVNSGDIIRYTITAKNSGNLIGETTITDKMLKDNITANKIAMMLDNEAISGEQNYTAKTIKINSKNKDNPQAISANELANGVKLKVEKGETATITFDVIVGELLPGDTIINKLEGQEENKQVENDVEAAIVINKKIVNPQNTVIVIDLSLSMAEAVDYSGSSDPMAETYEKTRWYALTQALDSFLETYMNGENTVTIIGYNDTASNILVENEKDKERAKNSYTTVLTKSQFDSTLNIEKNRGDVSDVDHLVGTKNKDDKGRYTNTGTLLDSGTNIDDGLRKAINKLGNNAKGAQVILMTDGEANRKGSEPNGKYNNEEAIKAAEEQAKTLKRKKATLYTVSLSLGSGNAEYIERLKNMASEDENGVKLSKSTETMQELVDYFKKMSESISEQKINGTTSKGILTLDETLNIIDSRYVEKVIIDIPNNNGIGKIELEWNQFTPKYYNIDKKTINITELARDNKISGITGNVSIEINVNNSK